MRRGHHVSVKALAPADPCAYLCVHATLVCLAACELAPCRARSPIVGAQVLRASPPPPPWRRRPPSLQLADPSWIKYILPKGFVSVDGCSLTVGEVTDTTFSVYLIPETLRWARARSRCAAAPPGPSANPALAAHKARRRTQAGANLAAPPKPAAAPPAR